MKIKDNTKLRIAQLKQKKWNLKNLEWFLLDDSYFFNEYWLYYTKNLIKEFIKKNKKKWITLFDEIKNWDISLNFTWLISVTSWLWYTPDKISHITLWYREKAIMYKFYTEEGYDITLTANQPILTDFWYKKAKDIKVKDFLIGNLWLANKWFKTSKDKEKYENINTIISNIAHFDEDWFLDYSKISTHYKKYLNILWIHIWSKISKEEFFKLIKSEKDINNIIDINAWLKDSDKKILIQRKIIKIEKIEMHNIYIWNITTHLSNNININNFILKNWS